MFSFAKRAVLFKFIFVTRVLSIKIVPQYEI